MRRTLLPLLVLLALVAAVSFPADAHHKGKHKPKRAPQPPAVVQGSYPLELRPDPSYYVTDARSQWCRGLVSENVAQVPDSQDLRRMRFPAPGTLTASLVPEVSSFPVGPEWDLVLRSGGRTLTRATPSQGVYELSYATPFSSQPFELVACNKSGWPKVTVRWSFRYR